MMADRKRSSSTAKLGEKTNPKNVSPKEDNTGDNDNGKLPEDNPEINSEGEEEEKNRSGEEQGENVKVMVRCRPLTVAEKKDSLNKPNVELLKLFEDDKCIQINGQEVRQFQFDAIFGPNSDNELVYMKSMRQLVHSAFLGYNCTVFLYGQTGTGKTYTHSSLTLSAFAHLFSLISDSNNKARFLIRASYYELYNEEIYDLLATKSGKGILNQKPLKLCESKTRGVYVKDLSNYLVNNLTELEKLKKIGDKQRTVAATKMNEHSSRSHSIFTITIEFTEQENNQKRPITAKSVIGQSAGAESAATSGAGQPVRVGRLNLIDLAGSERQSKTVSSGTRLKEASKINLSLTCLSLVIRALTDKGSQHIPYRNSKLTRLLSSSLGGNSKTLLIACISPATSNFDETLNTLRFASRTKRIKNKAKINEDSKDALLRKYRKQIEELRSKLRDHQERNSNSSANDNYTDDDAAAIESLMMEESSSSLKDDKSANQGGENKYLLEQLKMLKGKIMVGGENLLEKAEMHERLLEASRQEIEEKQREEAKLKNKLEKKHKMIEKMTKSKGSLESQVLELDERLKRVLLLYKRTKEEQKDLTSEHQILKESLLQTIRATSKEIKYADCIIESFIPRDYLDLINAYARYDEDSDEWQIKYIAMSGNNMAQTRRLADQVQHPATIAATAANNQTFTSMTGIQESQLVLSSASSNRSSNTNNTNPTKIKKFNTSRPDPYIRLKSLIR